MVHLYSLSLAIIELLGAALLTGDISGAVLVTLRISRRALRGLLALAPLGVSRGPWRHSPPAVRLGSPHNSGGGSFKLKLALSVITLVVTANSIAAAEDEETFMAENMSAMSKMMSAMDVKPSGDVDADFVAMMAPHHQGAIDMAKAELSYGHNEQLRRLAQEIIVTQKEEIQAMQLALNKPPSPPVPPPNHLPGDRREDQRSIPHSIMHN
jgi:hypothetical protein